LLGSSESGDWPAKMALWVGPMLILRGPVVVEEGMTSCGRFQLGRALKAGVGWIIDDGAGEIDEPSTPPVEETVWWKRRVGV